MYAVNLADWHGHKDDVGLIIILMPVTEKKKLVICKKDKIDSQAVLLDCNDKRGAAIIHIIRQQYKKHELRLYHSKTGKGWKRV